MRTELVRYYWYGSFVRGLLCDELADTISRIYHKACLCFRLVT